MHTKMARPTLMLFALLFIAPVFTGCRVTSGVRNYLAYNTPSEDFVTGWRDKVWGGRAYNQRRHCFGNVQYEADFRAGFLAGYKAIAQGGDGCTPDLPPRRYWSWRYQTAEGQAKVGAWFSGYPHGVQAAEEDGIGNYYEIQLGPNIAEPESDNPFAYPNRDLGIEPTPIQPESVPYEEIPPTNTYEFNAPQGSGVVPPVVIEPVGYFSTPVDLTPSEPQLPQMERLPSTFAHEGNRQPNEGYANQGDGLLRADRIDSFELGAMNSKAANSNSVNSNQMNETVTSLPPTRNELVSDAIVANTTTIPPQAFAALPRFGSY